MRVSALKYAVLSWLSGMVMIIILLMPFHAFLTVWGSTLVHHYTALRLWKEVLLMVCVAGVLYLLATDHKIRSYTLTRRLVWLILAFIAVNLIWGAVASHKHAVTAKALGYGLITDLRFVIFFLITWALALRTKRLRTYWELWVLCPAVIVVAFGIIQELFLTPRFLEHFGYSMFTILPFQYVDNQAGLLRIQSTLRGANPLGAYLVVVICVIAELLANGRVKKHKKLLLAFGLASLVAMYFTYSRSAWIGLFLGLSAIVAITLSSFIKKHAWLIGAGIVVVIAGLGLAARHNNYVETTILHTNQHAKAHVTSNEARSSELRKGLSDVAHHPLGSGPGTAGPASVYNTGHPARIAENFFIQIGQETGWLGLALFLAVNAGVGYLLWLRRADPLALGLFASLVGLTFVNLVSHAWADDTLAYIWWGLAGIALAPQVKKD